MPKINWLEVGAPLPPTHGATVDLLRDIRDLRLSMEKEVEAIKKRETELKEALIGVFDPVRYPGAIGQRYKATLTTTDVATISDWSAFHAYIKDSGRFDMLQKRANSAVIIEAQAAFSEQARRAILLPGVAMMTAKDLSITKR